MAVFPKIQSPCPYKSRLAEVMDGDMCRMCNRQVFDLTHMSDGERVAFLSGCTEEVCVSYSLRPAIAAAALAAAALAIPTAAAAQDQGTADAQAAAVAAALEEATPSEYDIITVGGIKDPAAVEYVETAADLALPDLPVVYEEAQAAQAASPASAADPAPAARANGARMAPLQSPADQRGK